MNITFEAVVVMVAVGLVLFFFYWMITDVGGKK